MKTFILILFITFFLISCSKQIKFDKEVWFNKELIFVDERREKMVNDIIDSYLEKRPKYNKVVEYLGEPDRIDSLNFMFSYIIFVDFQGCPMLEDWEMKFLDIKFNEDSTASKVFIREYGLLKKSYILGEK